MSMSTQWSPGRPTGGTFLSPKALGGATTDMRRPFTAMKTVLGFPRAAVEQNVEVQQKSIGAVAKKSQSSICSPLYRKVTVTRRVSSNCACRSLAAAPQ
eukprot:CAMPEP_0194530428 /NCGR_PEP_ID=MMETSP0253-20130528/67390_1 /TAXON_ID=2966 /ORGANISM="Noctiluca scintillans" /LENGTH=98 /DNA_ID=CAMNT_0039375665 /DNA_START=98 /DNA_END=394 /DNA_ORIENTATION=+